jgi:hypothetical protein
MILLPLMATWIWFHILTASPLLSSDHPGAETRYPDISLYSSH